MKRGSLIGTFFGFVARHALSMIIIVGFCITLGILFLSFTTYKYKVTMEVASFAMQNNTNQGVSLPNAQLFGVESQSSKLSAFGLYTHNFETYQTAEALYEDEIILRAMFPDRWDSENGRWNEQEGPFIELRRSFAELIGYPISTEVKPGPDALWKAIRHQLTIEVIDDSMRKLTVYVTNPAFGIRLLDRLHEIADENARQFFEKSSTERLALLQDRYEQTDLQNVRETLVDLLVVHERMLIMTRGGQNFAAEQFQRPVAEVAPSRPNPIHVLGLATAGGIILFLLRILRLESRRIARERGPVYLDDLYQGSTPRTT